MTETLVEILAKAGEYNHKVLLERARGRFEAIDKAVRGEISFLDIINSLERKYHGLRIFLPRLKDKEYDRMMDDLRLGNLFQVGFYRTDFSEVLETEGNLNRVPKYSKYMRKFLGFVYDKLANPITLSLAMGGYVAIISGGQGKYESELANYAVSFGLGTIVGIAFGFLGLAMRRSEMNVAKSQAKFLQQKIEEHFYR